MVTLMTVTPCLVILQCLISTSPSPIGPSNPTAHILHLPPQSNGPDSQTFSASENTTHAHNEKNRKKIEFVLLAKTLRVNSDELGNPFFILLFSLSYGSVLGLGPLNTNSPWNFSFLRSDLALRWVPIREASAESGFSLPLTERRRLICSPFSFQSLLFCQRGMMAFLM
ncbi:hypothetical protein RIF29_16154 [Crotalaria pallida]|uniref:Uncharacterized protein n=1 Tax=Crotalaria pallida TaxID=3830 RepID=A0AAN9ID99_CROPI